MRRRPAAMSGLGWCFNERLLFVSSFDKLRMRAEPRRGAGRFGDASTLVVCGASKAPRAVCFSLIRPRSSRSFGDLTICPSGLACVGGADATLKCAVARPLLRAGGPAQAALTQLPGLQSEYRSSSPCDGSGCTSGPLTEEDAGKITADQGGGDKRAGYPRPRSPSARAGIPI